MIYLYPSDARPVFAVATFASAVHYLAIHSHNSYNLLSIASAIHV